MPKKKKTRRVPHCVWCKGTNIVRAFSAASWWDFSGLPKGPGQDTYRCLDCQAADRASLSTPMWDQHYHDVPEKGMADG